MVLNTQNKGMMWHATHFAKVGRLNINKTMKPAVNYSSTPLIRLKSGTYI